MPFLRLAQLCSSLTWLSRFRRVGEECNRQVNEDVPSKQSTSWPSIYRSCIRTFGGAAAGCSLHEEGGLECEEYSNSVRRNNLYPPMRRIQIFSSHRALAERVLKFKLDVDHCPLLPPLRVQRSLANSGRTQSSRKSWTDT